MCSLLIFTGCTSEEKKLADPKTVFANTFEPNDWAIEQLNTIQNVAISHSGKLVCVIDSVRTASLQIVKQIKDISQEKIDSVAFSYWVFLKTPTATAKTVLSVDELTGKNVLWIGNSINDKTKELNKWVKIQETFQLPKDMDTKNILKAYVWNTSKEQILLDDFVITFY